MSNIFRLKVYLALICSVISRMLSRAYAKSVFVGEVLFYVHVVV